MAGSSLTYIPIPAFSVKFFFQLIYTDLHNGYKSAERKISN
jgi:hypothetical protein